MVKNWFVVTKDLNWNGEKSGFHSLFFFFELENTHNIIYQSREWKKQERKKGKAINVVEK